MAPSDRLTIPADPLGAVVVVGAWEGGTAEPDVDEMLWKLDEGGLATLVVDLMAPRGAAELGPCFDIRRTVDQLIVVTDRLRATGDLSALPIAYVGVGAGSAAALWAASLLCKEVRWVASVDGRLDYAERWLFGVEAPTLLVVGERDPVLFDINENARARLHCPTSLVTCPDRPAAIGLVVDWLGRRVHAGVASRPIPSVPPTEPAISWATVSHPDGASLARSYR